jgi:hypothetical protein
MSKARLSSVRPPPTVRPPPRDGRPEYRLLLRSLTKTSAASFPNLKTFRRQNERVENSCDT